MGMGRFILTFYVGIQAFAILLSIFTTLWTGEAVHILNRDDWWMFIVSCGILAICEALEVED